MTDTQREDVIDRVRTTLGRTSESDEEVVDVVLAVLPVPPDEDESVTVLASRAWVDEARAAHWRCDCVPTLGPAHCHACSTGGLPVVWADCPEAAPVVDEGEVYRILAEAFDDHIDEGSPARRMHFLNAAARGVAAHLRGADRG